LEKVKSRDSNARLFAFTDWPVAPAPRANANARQFIHLWPARGGTQSRIWRPTSRTQYLFGFAPSLGDVAGFCAAIDVI